MGILRKIKGSLKAERTEESSAPASDSKKKADAGDASKVSKVAKGSRNTAPEVQAQETLEIESPVAAPTAKTVAAGDRKQTILVAPLVTEKSATLSGENTFAFLVRPDANKIEIKKAVTDAYGVTPVSVRVMNYRGKAVRFGRRYGKRKDFRKALVTLKKGDSLVAETAAAKKSDK